MNLAIELEQEEEGRRIAEIDELDRDANEEATVKVRALTAKVLADGLNNHK
jgi:hypothetical protein